MAARSARQVWFRWRGFVALFAAMLFIGATTSGILLYAGPSGRTARRLEWDFLGLDRHQWWVVHCVHSLILMGIIAAHVYFNWKPLVHHATRTIASLRFMHRELFAAFALTVFVTVGSAIEFPPFDAMLKLQEVIRNWWAEQPTPTTAAASTTAVEAPLAAVLEAGAETESRAAGADDATESGEAGDEAADG